MERQESNVIETILVMNSGEAIRLQNVGSLMTGGLIGATREVLDNEKFSELFNLLNTMSSSAAQFPRPMLKFQHKI